MGKEARSFGNLFMFRESEKSLKETPGGSFFMCLYPYGSEKEIKVYLVTFSYYRARERTKTVLISATR